PPAPSLSPHCSSVHRQGEHEGRAARLLNRGGAHGDRTTVRLDDRLADGETDTARRRAFPSLERFEDPVPLAGVDAGAVVGYGDLDPLLVRPGPHPHE